MAEPRRFPPPWTVEETAPCFIVRDANKQALAFVYCEDKPGRRVVAIERPALRVVTRCLIIHTPIIAVIAILRCVVVRSLTLHRPTLPQLPPAQSVRRQSSVPPGRRAQRRSYR